MVESESHNWKLGDVIAGKYVIETVVGQGGMGTVVKAMHRELEEPVALKLLKPSWRDDPEVVARFLREARALVKLKGPHVAQVFDVGRLDDGTPFIVMEYLDGEDLGAIMSRGWFPLREVVDLIIEACDALGEAHAHEITHRDIKPENLFLVSLHGRSQLKLLDFGISKMALKPGELAVTSHMVGTPLYMSPEQIRASATTDHRTDIWSLGAVLYELLAGQPPFQADTLPEVCALILEAEPAPLSSVRPDVPAELDRIVARCLAKRREDRYQNVAELALELLPFAHPRQHTTVEHLTRVLRSAGIKAPVLPSVPPSPGDRLSYTTDPAADLGGPTPIVTTSDDVSTLPAPASTRGRSGRLVLLIGVGALLMSGAAAFLLKQRGSSAELSAATGTRPTLSATAAPEQPPSVSASAPASTPAPSASASAAPSAPTAASASQVLRPLPRKWPPTAASAPAPRPKLEILQER